MDSSMQPDREVVMERFRKQRGHRGALLGRVLKGAGTLASGQQPRSTRSLDAVRQVGGRDRSDVEHEIIWRHRIDALLQRGEIRGDPRRSASLPVRRDSSRGSMRLRTAALEAGRHAVTLADHRRATLGARRITSTL